MMRYFIGLFILFATAWAQEFKLELFLNNESIPFELTSGALDGSSKITTITFEGGKLELNLEDWNTFDYAHVLATTFEKTAENTYTVSATVRHNDTGWDSYADAFEVKGNDIQNGLRVLAHPHENEQPFTRSQSGVVAAGLVWVEAKDNVEGLGGSKIYLDLAHPRFASQNIIEITYQLTQ
jgi:hypothetical protein